MRRFFFTFLGVLLLAVLIRLGINASEGWDESIIKHLLVPMASMYLAIFSHPLTAVCLSGAMICSGLAILAWLRFAQFAPAMRALRHVSEEIGRIEADRDDPLRLRRLDRVLETNRYLARSWRHYRATLLVPTDVDSAMWSSARPGQYFSLRSLQHCGVDIALLRGLPSYYVGAGLLFTFMGLVAGLYFASRGLMASDLATARQALIQLLHTSTFKFSTSVAGLAMSLVFLIYGHFLIARLDRQLDDVCDGLERLIPCVPAHLDMRLRPIGLETGAGIHGIIRSGSPYSKLEPSEARPAVRGRGS